MMRVLLTGATGYIGQQLLRKLLNEGHEVICCVRNPERFRYPEAAAGQVKVVKADFVEMDPGQILEYKADVAYYLIHSMTSGVGDFERLEKLAASNFLHFIRDSGLRQVIYLGGIVNEQALSKHLKSRLIVETTLRSGSVPVTALRAGIIVGAGSASFELIRDLVEKLPVMITPRWLLTRSQPIAVDDVIALLTGVALRAEFYGKAYDIGGPDVLSYKEMLEQYAEVRGLRRSIWTVPVMTPRLSSYWLYFVTAVSYPLAVNLVNSMKVEVICRPNTLTSRLGVNPLTYKEAVSAALKLYLKDALSSSWKDALSSSFTGTNLKDFEEVPQYGVLRDQRKMEIGNNEENVLNNLWTIGGRRGWYYGDWLWRLRGFLDKLFGGVGLRRGRTHEQLLEPGDALDFWRVLVADREAGRLLLFAEMKLPGEAWLEFRLSGDAMNRSLVQTATFRPRGLLGRLYWYLVMPLHFFVFGGMIRGIVNHVSPGSVKDAESMND